MIHFKIIGFLIAMGVCLNPTASGAWWGSHHQVTWETNEPKEPIALTHCRDVLEAVRAFRQHVTEALESKRYDEETFERILAEAVAGQKLLVLSGALRCDRSSTVFTSADGKRRYTICLYKDGFLSLFEGDQPDFICRAPIKDSFKEMIYEDFQRAADRYLEALPKWQQESRQHAASSIEDLLKFKPSVSPEELLESSGMERAEAERFLEGWRRGDADVDPGSSAAAAFLQVWREGLACMWMFEAPRSIMSFDAFAEAMKDQAKRENFPEALRFYVPRDTQNSSDAMFPYDVFFESLSTLSESLPKPSPSETLTSPEDDASGTAGEAPTSPTAAPTAS